ncbi:MAG: rhodanese-like domain-containing protein [Thermoanaerobaculia bacterium]
MGAAICALVANATAPQQRQLRLVGSYPNALRIPARASSPALPAPSSASESAAAVTQTSIVSQAPGIPPATDSSSPAATPAVKITPLVHEPASDKIAKPTLTTSHPPSSTNGISRPVAPAANPAPPVKASGSASADVSRFSPHPEKAYVEIGGADVAALHSAGALFLDARRTSVFEQGHVAGARSISVWESDLEEKVRRLFDERSDARDQAKPVVIYCSGGDCEDSHMLAEKLWGIQFNNVYVYKDGFPDWQKRGGAVRTGTAP